MKTNEQKLEAAKQYLRDRKIYLLEFPFTPTPSTATSVTNTIAKYRRQTEGVMLATVPGRRRQQAK